MILVKQDFKERSSCGCLVVGEIAFSLCSATW
jgi:hypothetical protein